VIVRDAKRQIDKDTAVAALASRRAGKARFDVVRLQQRRQLRIGAVGGHEPLSTILLKSRMKTEVERVKLRATAITARFFAFLPRDRRPRV
jgi:hypothetical protein